MQQLPVELSNALEPVLRDLEMVDLRPHVEPDQWSGTPGQITAMSRWPDGSGTGIWVIAGEGLSQQIASLADQIQEAAVETLPSIGRPAVWPECPDHPGTHPLQATCDGSNALWACPKTGQQIAEIGSLLTD